MSRPESTTSKFEFAALAVTDEQLAPLANSPYTKAQPERVAATKAALEANGFIVEIVKTKDEAFEAIKKLIPVGASVNNAHSASLEEVGFTDYLKSGEHEWDNVHATILAETDFLKQWKLRRTIGATVDYFLTSMAAVTETGVLVHADGSGTKVAPVSLTAGKVIVLVGSNKIVADEKEGIKRTEELALPATSAWARAALGYPGMAVTHLDIIRANCRITPGRITVLLADFELGY